MATTYQVKCIVSMDGSDAVGRLKEALAPHFSSVKITECNRVPDTEDLKLLSGKLTELSNLFGPGHDAQIIERAADVIASLVGRYK